MLNTPCPYCHHPEMPEPPKTARPYASCPKCGKKSRAKLAHTKDGQIVVSYSATSLPRVNERDRKRVRTVALSDADMEAIESGIFSLTVRNGHIIIAV